MKTNNCKNCRHCYAVYRKRYSMRKTEWHYCNVMRTLTDYSQSCEHRQKKKREYDVSDARLEQAENDLKYLIEHIEYQ